MLQIPCMLLKYNNHSSSIVFRRRKISEDDAFCKCDMCYRYIFDKRIIISTTEAQRSTREIKQGARKKR